MLRRYLILPSLLIASLLSLAACGSSGSDDTQIEDAIETSATSTDPANCKEFATQQFMEQTTRSEGARAVEACEEKASQDEGANAATVSSVEVDGSEASADVALSGGSFDGQEVKVALIKESDQWKLDKLTGFVKFNEAKVIGALEREFGKPSDKEGKRIVSCIFESLEDAPQADFEDALLSASTKGLEELAGDCI